MIEYRIRRIDGSGTGDMERVCNDLAKDGWRLVSTAAGATGILEVFVYLFFERQAGQQETQDTWRARHGGQDAD